MPSLGLVLEILLLGGALVWLLALLPALIVCIRHEEWGGFFAGLLTFGGAWIVSALALQPSRLALRLIAGGACAVVFLGSLAARPTPIVGMDGEALSTSFRGVDLLESSSRPCNHLDENEWTCGRYDTLTSGDVPFRLRVDGLGCWDARREWQDRPIGQARDSGCISAIDYLF